MLPSWKGFSFKRNLCYKTLSNKLSGGVLRYCLFQTIARSFKHSFKSRGSETLPCRGQNTFRNESLRFCSEHCPHVWVDISLHNGAHEWERTFQHHCSTRDTQLGNCKPQRTQQNHMLTQYTLSTYTHSISVLFSVLVLSMCSIRQSYGDWSSRGSPCVALWVTQSLTPSNRFTHKISFECRFSRRLWARKTL